MWNFGKSRISWIELDWSICFLFSLSPSRVPPPSEKAWSLKTHTLDTRMYCPLKPLTDIHIIRRFRPLEKPSNWTNIQLKLEASNVHSSSKSITFTLHCAAHRQISLNRSLSHVSNTGSWGEEGGEKGDSSNSVFVCMSRWPTPEFESSLQEQFIKKETNGKAWDVFYLFHPGSSFSSLTFDNETSTDISLQKRLDGHIQTCFGCAGEIPACSHPYLVLVPRSLCHGFRRSSTDSVSRLYFLSYLTSFGLATEYVPAGGLPWNAMWKNKQVICNLRSSKRRTDQDIDIHTVTVHDPTSIRWWRRWRGLGNWHPYSVIDGETFMAKSWIRWLSTLEPQKNCKGPVLFDGCDFWVQPKHIMDHKPIRSRLRFPGIFWGRVPYATDM